jgi:uncharacterized membrane protein
MNLPSILCGAEAVKDDGYFREITAKIVSAREDFEEKLRGMGFVFRNSKSNFVFARHPDISGDELFEKLRGEKHLRAPFRAPAHPRVPAYHHRHACPDGGGDTRSEGDTGRALKKPEDRGSSPFAAGKQLIDQYGHRTESSFMESLATWFANNLGQHISAQWTVFIVSLLPILECRGGLIVSALLEVDIRQAVPICILGNILPIPFILLFIKKIFAWLKKFKFWRPIITRLENRAMKQSTNMSRGEFWGLLIFVGIPLPGTGAWDGLARSFPSSTWILRRLPSRSSSAYWWPRSLCRSYPTDCSARSCTEQESSPAAAGRRRTMADTKTGEGDYLITATAAPNDAGEPQVRAFAATTRGIAEEARIVHGQSPVVDGCPRPAYGLPV